MASRSLGRRKLNNEEAERNQAEALAHARRAAEFAKRANETNDATLRTQLLHLRQLELRKATDLGMPLNEAIAVATDAPDPITFPLPKGE